MASDRSAARGAAQRMRLGRLAVVMVFSFALQAGQLAVAGDACDDFKADVAEQYKRDQLINQSLVKQSKDQLTNALNCLQQVKKILAVAIDPTSFDWVEAAAEKLVAYVAARACRVVVETVNEKVIDPMNGAIGNVNNLTQEYNNYINGVAGKINSEVGTPVVTTGGTQAGSSLVSGAAEGSAVVTPQAAARRSATSAAPATSGGIWNSLGCAFGAGSNCK